jgi:hypothetical protein
MFPFVTYVQNSLRNSVKFLTFLRLPTVLEFTSLFLCGVTLIWFPDDDPMGIETCRNVQCDTVI